MNVIRWLVHKDLARFFADRNGALLTFVIPMALAALLGSLFGQDDKATVVELLVVDRDESAETQSLVKALQADETLDVTVTTEEDARARGDRVASHVEGAAEHPRSGGATQPLHLEIRARRAQGVSEGEGSHRHFLHVCDQEEALSE